MASIQAAVLDAPNSQFKIRELELRCPGVNEVQIRIDAVGVCHTDAVVQAGQRTTQFPVVLGHEGTGIVTAIGDNVEHLATGDRVVLTFASCGDCPQCRTGMPSYCARFSELNFSGGHGHDGGTNRDKDGNQIGSKFFGQSSFATRVNVVARNTVKVTTDLPAEVLAPVGCGILTGVGTVWNVLQPSPGHDFIVYGLGAVGLSAIAAAKAKGCARLVGVDTVPERLEVARRMGATEVYGAGEDIPGQFDRALDTTADGVIFAQTLAQLGPLGHAAFVGASIDTTNYAVDVKNLLLKGIRFSLVVEGSSEPTRDIPRIVSAMERGELPVYELIETFELGQINAAFESSRTGHSIKPVLKLN